MTRRTFALALLAASLLPVGVAEAQPAGVTLYRGPSLTGERLSFDRDVFDLNETSFGARRARSVDVSRGCRATLFAQSGYRGESVVLSGRVEDLGGTALGRDSVGSLRVDCAGAAGLAQGLPQGSGWSPAGAGRGATLFEDARYEGASESFLTDVPDLSRSRLGARRASSIEVAPGCVAVLFSETGYRGRSTTFREAHDNLRLTDVGNDAASSLRVDCGGTGTAQGSGWSSAGAGRGVTLYADARYEGPSESFLEDVPDLSRTTLGARRASSIGVPEGCVAVLFAETEFRGRSTTFREPHDNLRETEVGNDAAASLRVDCPGSPRRPRPIRRFTPGAGSPLDGVTLYRDKDFRGASESFRSDVPDLSRTRVGGRAASSIRVPEGCRATLFSEPDYRGRSATFEEEHGNLRETPIGNDAALSLRVECGSRRW